MPGKHRMVETSKKSKTSDMDRMFLSGWAPGLTEIALMRALSEESVSAGFIPSVVMCAGCGEKPAESRDESVFALCAGCCEMLRKSYMSDSYGQPGSSEMSDSDRMTHVWREMHGKFGYAMMDAELSKMFD